MASLTPLQLIAASALLDNQGIASVPTALDTAINDFNNTTLISNFITAVNYYVAQSWATASTLSSLLTIGQFVCPALGNSVPSLYPNLTPISNPPGFSGLIEQTAYSYLGDGDIGKFAQGFMAVNGWIKTTNDYINAAINAQTYLGPTFTNMDSLVTNNISNVNSNFAGFAVDLHQQGQLWNLADLESYGTPGGLLRQLSAVGQLQGGTLRVVQDPLNAAGLSNTDIQQLIAGQGDLNLTEYNQLQQMAYAGMTNVTGADLQQVLNILDVTTPNIQTMADLLNPVKTFPNSYSTLKTISPTGPIPIYNPGTSVPSNVSEIVSQYLPTPTGCDELAKVMPPAQAVANKAIQVALQDITGIPLSTLADLADAVQGGVTTPWNPNVDYLPNEIVQYGTGVPTYYQAQQDVPVGTDINDTNYWQPTTLGGLNTMAGLPAIQALTTPIPASTASYFANNVATGSGPNGTITLYDVLGLAVDYDSTVSSNLNTATSSINALQSFGSLTALNSAYTGIAAASNDSQVIGFIAAANSAISSLVASPYLPVLNTAWDNIARMLSQEKIYQTSAGIDYANLQAGENNSIYALVQQLPTYGLDTAAGGAAQFLTEVADTTIIGGQAIVGSMRQGQNQVRLSDAQLGQDIAPSSNPAVEPVPAVTPVY